MKIDINKKYRCANGNAVVIHGLNGPIEGRPVVYSRQSGAGTWFLDSCAEDGTDPDGQSGFSLVEIREPLECWAWVSGSGEMSDGAMTVKKPGNVNYRKFREIIE